MMLPFNDRCYHDNKSARNQMNSIAKKMLIYSILSFSQQKKRFLIKVLDSGLRRITSHLPACWLSGLARSLSDLKEIYCKFAWTAHISPLSWSIEQLLTCETSKICPRPAKFSLRFFKSDRLLGVSSMTNKPE